MQEIKIENLIHVFDSIEELIPSYKSLLQKAKMNTSNAYAPYSKFNVGAAILLENDTIVLGTNQENASSPVGICAERVAIAYTSSQYPGVIIKAIAISVKTLTIVDAPVSPCGICRQTLLEYELKQKSNIEIILQGETGKIYIIPSAKSLLPLYFSRTDLK